VTKGHRKDAGKGENCLMWGEAVSLRKQRTGNRIQMERKWEQKEKV